MTTVKQQIRKERLEHLITRLLKREGKSRLRLSFRNIMEILNNCKNSITETEGIKY